MQSSDSNILMQRKHNPTLLYEKIVPLNNFDSCFLLPIKYAKQIYLCSDPDLDSFSKICRAAFKVFQCKKSSSPYAWT